MASPTEICNMALGLIAEQRIVGDMGAPPATSTIELIQRFYAPARNAILALHAWKYASGWAPVTPIPEPEMSVPAGRMWRREYALITQPPVVAVWELDDREAEFETAYNHVIDRDVVYTNALTSAASCTFVREDTGRWDPIAVQALAHKLAADLVMAKTGETGKYGALLEGMNFWLGQATAKDGKRMSRTALLPGRLTRSRG